MRTTLLLLLCLTAGAAPVLADQRHEWQGIDRVVVFGDLHGDYEQYVRLLQLNELVDRRLRWAGGATHLVQLGDVVDRGPDSLRIMRHLEELAEDAERDGGYVHTLIGNHEAMNIEGDLRYVHPGEYEALTTWQSKRLRRDYLARVRENLEATRPELFETPEVAAQTEAKLDQQVPLGYVEHRRIWYPGSELADYVTDNNTVIKINRSLFVHAGLDPHAPPEPLGTINERVREILSDPQLARTRSFVNAEAGPLWYRGLARNDAETELAPLLDLLAYHGADRIVVAHTPTATGLPASRLDGRVILADVGISAHYGGHLANVEIRPHGAEEGAALSCVVFSVTTEGRSCLE